jgi:hypothetical protein
MAAIPCDACGGKMNDGLAVCPHCGARRALADRPKLSGDEIRALLATDPRGRDGEPRGVFQTLVLPHPATTGLTRLAELVLTGLSLPLVLGSAATLALTRRRALSSDQPTGEVVPAVLATFYGGGALLGPVPGIAIFALVAALWLRVAVRAWARGPRVDLQHIDPPPRRPALPVARVIHDDAAAAAAPPPAPAPSPTTASPEPPLDRGGPRMLR